MLHSDPAGDERQVFPRLGGEGLAALELVGRGLYVYSFVTRRICWANAAALEFWGAPDAAELYQRELTPYSDATETRLASSLEAFRRGEVREESWTYYPHGRASTALARCSGVSLDGHAEAMLVELSPLAPESPLMTELRAIEVSRHTPLMVSLFDQAGAVLMHNPAAERFFRAALPRAPADGDSFAAMFTSRHTADQLRADAASAGLAFRTASMIGADKPLHAVQVSAVRDPATGLPALLVTQSDVSQYMVAARQLAASQEALDAVLSLDAAAALVLSVDDGAVLKANHALESLLGRPVGADERAGDLFCDGAAFQRLRDTSLTREGGSLQLRLNTADGSMPWTLVSVAPIVYQQHQAIVVFITDVDRLFRLAASLEQELDSEREVAQLQRRILAIASHDIRTPMAIIDSVAQRLLRQAEVISAEAIVGAATRIRSVVRRMVDLLENTLERVGDSVRDLTYAPVSARLADSIATVVHGFEESHPRPLINLDLDDLPPFPFDRALIEQALANLIDNAIKYSPGRARIGITARRFTRDVRVEIRDHGMGIPPGEWEQVFAENARGTNADRAEGTGLGLSIVRQIVDLHGGEVRIVPTDGPGTTFLLSLPCAVAECEAAGTA